MKNKDKLIVIGAAVLSLAAIFVTLYLYLEGKRKDKKIIELEEDKLKLIIDSLKRDPNLSEEIKRQIQKLIADFKTTDEKISNKLAQALQLFQINQVENAIEDLVKIIEHLLTTHYQEDPKFKKWLKEQKKKFDLHNLLSFCRSENKINDVEFHFFIAIKAIRNKEAHTLDFKLDEYLNASGLIAAIGGIFKLGAIVYPKTPQPLIIENKDIETEGSLIGAASKPLNNKLPKIELQSN